MFRNLTCRALALAMLAAIVQPYALPLWAQTAAGNALVGKVSAYACKTRILTVKTDKAFQEFLLSDKASVRVGSKVVPLEELEKQVGRKVKVRYTESGGKRVVTSLMISHEY